MNMNEGTIPQKRKRAVRVSKEECLLLLRSYREHPTRWKDIITDIKSNIDQLPAPARELYAVASVKQLQDRLSSKLGKFMSTRLEDIEDEDIRNAVRSIVEHERRHVGRPVIEQVPVAPQNPMMQPEEVADQVPFAPQAGPAHEDAPQPGPANAQRRDAAAAAMSTSESDDDEEPARPRKKRLVELMRQNHELYHKFMTKKMPKILRALDISSDSE